MAQVRKKHCATGSTQVTLADCRAKCLNTDRCLGFAYEFFAYHCGHRCDIYTGSLAKPIVGYAGDTAGKGQGCYAIDVCGYTCQGNRPGCSGNWWHGGITDCNCNTGANCFKQEVECTKAVQTLKAEHGCPTTTSTATTTTTTTTTITTTTTTITTSTTTTASTTTSTTTTVVPPQQCCAVAHNNRMGQCPTDYAVYASTTKKDHFHNIGKPSAQYFSVCDNGVVTGWYRACLSTA